MSATASSLQQYEFNAKALSGSDVARTFVAPTLAFDRLLTRNNSLVIGPRGSGKTTLLKMLTRKALLNWDALTLEEYGQRVRFHSAFIPADRAWGAQLAAADRYQGSNSTDEMSRGEAAFAIQTMIGLAVALRDAREHQEMPSQLRHLSVKLDANAENDLVKALDATLEVSSPVPTLLGFEIALRTALMKISPRPGSGGVPFWADASRLAEAVANCLTICSSFIQTETDHWALLFDELEIAPPAIKNSLMESLRSSDQRLVFKLALVPYLSGTPSLQGTFSPQVGHDFEVVSLSYPHKKDAEDFSRDLAARAFARVGVTAVELPRILGPSVFQAGRARVSSYIRGSAPGADPLDTVFQDLARKDESFADYLRSKNLNEAGARLGESDRAAHVRKILPSVILRDYFLREYRNDWHAPTLFRSRKSAASLYTGYPSLLEVADGNPRTLLYLLLPLVDELESRFVSDKKAKLDSSIQSRAVLRANYTLVSLLRTMPPSWSSGDSPKGLMSFIDAIGNALQSRVLRGPFEADYVGSFTVPSNASDSTVAAVGDALNAGALIHLPDEAGLAESALVGLRGRRFRLSYSLAPRYRLPLTAGQAVSLNSLLLGRSPLPESAEQPSFNLGPMQ